MTYNVFSGTLNPYTTILYAVKVFSEVSEIEVHWTLVITR